MFILLKFFQEFIFNREVAFAPTKDDNTPLCRLRRTGLRARLPPAGEVAFFVLCMTYTNYS